MPELAVVDCLSFPFPFPPSRSLSLSLSLSLGSLQKEKNKELEGKARDAERKSHEERSLREAAERKLRALKKLMRGAEDGSLSGSMNPPPSNGGGMTGGTSTMSQITTTTESTAPWLTSDTIMSSAADAEATTTVSNDVVATPTDSSIVEAPSSNEFEPEVSTATTALKPPATATTTTTTVDLNLVAQQQQQGRGPQQQLEASKMRSTAATTGERGDTPGSSEHVPSSSTTSAGNPDNKATGKQTNKIDSSFGTTTTGLLARSDSTILQQQQQPQHLQASREMNGNRTTEASSSSKPRIESSQQPVAASTTSTHRKLIIEQARSDSTHAADGSPKTGTSSSGSTGPSSRSPPRDTSQRDRSTSISNGNKNTGADHRRNSTAPGLEQHHPQQQQQGTTGKNPVRKANSFARSNREDLGNQPPGSVQQQTPVPQPVQQQRSSASEFDPLRRSESTPQSMYHTVEGAHTILSASSPYVGNPAGNHHDEMYQQTAQLPVLMMDQQAMAYPIVGLANVEGMSIPTQPFMQMPTQQPQNNAMGTRTTAGYQDFAAPSMFLLQQTDLPQSSMMAFHQQPIIQWQENIAPSQQQLQQPQQQATAATLQPWQLSPGQAQAQYHSAQQPPNVVQPNPQQLQQQQQQPQQQQQQLSNQRSNKSVNGFDPLQPQPFTAYSDGVMVPGNMNPGTMQHPVQQQNDPFDDILRRPKGSVSGGMQGEHASRT